LQDLLGLGTEARMNVPGRAEGNWSWRYDSKQLDESVNDRLEALTTIFGRARRFSPAASPRTDPAVV
jgi:4-alpha-glucanotransferase